MNNKNIAIFILMITVVGCVIAIVTTNDSNLSQKVAYTKIEEGKNGVAELDLTEKDLGLQNNSKQVLGTQKDDHGCLSTAGYTWCEEKQKCLRLWEEPCTQDGVFEFMQELENTTKIEFSGSMPVDFSWKTSQGDIPLKGRRFDSIRVPFDQVQKVDKFFKTNSFKVDLSNSEAGTLATTTGYVKQPVLCLTISGPTGYKYASDDTWEPPEPNLYDIEVYCGLLQQQQQNKQQQR